VNTYQIMPGGSTIRDGESGQVVVRWVDGANAHATKLRQALNKEKEARARALASVMKNTSRAHSHAPDAVHVLGGMRNSNQARPTSTQRRADIAPLHPHGSRGWRGAFRRDCGYTRTGSNPVACVMLESLLYTLTVAAVAAGMVLAHAEFVNQHWGRYGHGG
jgi:hypothetical protein